MKQNETENGRKRRKLEDQLRKSNIKLRREKLKMKLEKL